MSILGADVVAFASWTADIGAPRVELIPKEQRPGTTRFTRMAAHVLLDVIDQSGVDPSMVATVYASAQGDRQCATLKALLPTTRFSTMIVAGAQTVAMGLLEAFAVLGRHAQPVALVVVEEPMSTTAGAQPHYDGLAAALLLCSTTRAPRRLEDLSLRPHAPAGRPKLAASVAANPCARALALVTALREGHEGPFVLETEARERCAVRWCVDLRVRSREPFARPR